MVNANEMRYRSYLLADELRQSSDDLTRLARTYVVSGDAKYEQQYMDILDIRNGKKARPLHYERIYWDFVAAGNNKPSPDGETIALSDLMKQAGFSQEEFAKLKEAQNNSDALVKTEVIAMNAVKGLFDDGTGKFSRQDAPNLEMARNLMHSAEYHQYKAQIMKPVNEFLVLLDNRTGAALAQATRASEQAYVATVALVAVALAATFVGLLLLYRRLVRQLGGEPAQALNIAEKIAGGDLAVPIDIRNDDRSSLMFALKNMRDSLAGIVSQVRVGTETIASASSQIAAGNLDLSARTEQQASSLEETASSMEELTSTVKQNADNAMQANSLAESASGVAVKGGHVVSQVVDTMGAINESARKIVDIIGVIDGIAFQTNILALNAAVEAARAGEQGRGFAVVASEVRNLAQRSASAAKEIKALIGDSVEKVDAGTKLVDQAGVTMAEVVASVQRVSDIISEITAASHEQRSGIEQINQAINQMDQVTQQNASLVEEAAAAAESMHEQSSKLANVVSVFKLNGMPAAPVAAPASPPRKATVKPLPRKTVQKVDKAAPVVQPPSRVARQAAARIANGQAVGEEWEEF
ncbi:MAG TPA: methyl-accepting chemotaxis protein [Noviherbaspirillum sp.]|nr:methyl-accepting chemotaxis protein [Noviherbaspirillum sp.]